MVLDSSLEAPDYCLEVSDSSLEPLDLSLEVADSSLKAPDCSPEPLDYSPEPLDYSLEVVDFSLKVIDYSLDILGVSIMEWLDGIKLYENGIVEIIGKNIIIKNIDDIFGILINNNCSTIILKKENIINEFFNLSTEIAGEILQKFSTYNKRMAIVGDFENIKSKSLKDFIYESNRTKQIIFVKTVEEALKIFNK